MLEGTSLKSCLRQARGWWYRQTWGYGRAAHRRRCRGYSRRWNLETRGFTKENFFSLFREKFLRDVTGRKFWELAGGDGLVGSLGVWLERELGWSVEIWEHRPIPRQHCRSNRPAAVIHERRSPLWDSEPGAGAWEQPWGVTARSAREAAWLCRAVRRGYLQPAMIGVWNPSERGVWACRLGAAGYRLELVYERTELYRRHG
ncbi:hypothetical protein EBT11_03435 [bacterium]|nr:hypothetical protein [bacterium]